MNKPASMSLREFFVKSMSLNLVMSEKIIDAVVAHQFDSANDALSLHHSVELSGFGTFRFNLGKAKKTMEKYLLIKEAYEKMLLTDLSPTKRKNIETRMISIVKDIKLLKPKLNETE